MLTKKEASLLDIVGSEFQQTGEYPSFKNLMDKMGYKSKRSISILVDRLIEKGLLGKGKNGGIKLVKSFNDPYHEETEDVPLLGEIACGVPIFAEQNVEAVFSISTKFLTPGSKYFLLRADGHSMNSPIDGREPIHNKDLILVKLQNWANDGDWVVALVNNEATIKEFHKKSDHILLLPRSNKPEYKPMILNEEFKIQGIVKKVFNDLSFAE